MTLCVLLKLVLQVVLDTEWEKRVDLLSEHRRSPPPSAPQKVHASASTSTSAPAPPSVPQAAPLVTNPVNQPVASTSNSHLATHHTAPAAVRSKSPQADMDVDLAGMSPEPDGRGEDLGTRDEQGDEIVRQLEKGLPRWEGFGDQGWDDIDPVSPLCGLMDFIRDTDLAYFPRTAM
jgi:chromatin structure-remodeling complex subunit RSC1/2